MYPHPYLVQLIADEHTRDMRATAAAATLTRRVRRARRKAAQAAARPHTSHGLLHTIPQPRESEETVAHRVA